ncbi:MAG TPA: M3 family oligoendopeptidase [Candidatus Scatomorpha stercorigallinarum]|uniref:M3 family oligoendopeptidase n=1 Tax=Candidatus Scatomorpha merdipullorum TaxID=2840927 RepID=A0A9D1FCI0_9FIRM|nr:M3 family oligoendopeptidase [Candidatus Scatomorpha merdipullorum]HIV21951.1 M3 family oligoendopeptidase [Candidatus Scatomorpha stercorigallinarum]
MKFSEMPYERPDIEALKKFLDDAAGRLAAARSFEEADAVFLEVERGTAHAETMLTIAHIRHDINTADEFYDKEVEFADQALPELQEYTQKWDLAMLKSPFRADFERKYNRIMFLNTEISLRTFSPEIVPELQRENALTTEYSKLIASAQIPFEGQVYTVSQLTPLKQDPDDARRAAAWKAEGEWYMQNAEKLDSIYDELVHLRDTMGKKLGHKNYIPLGYDRMGRNCYGQEDVERFRAAVVKHIVPLADQVYRRQAERLGKAYPMGYADNALEFRSGNARPCGGPEDILAAGRKFYHELSPETAEFIDVMYDNELLDVLSRKGKAGGGYCTSLGDYHVPFIFANFNGTSGDVEVVTHEAGHAFANYMGRDIVPASCQWPSMESCEVHSMSMEFFAWPWAESFFGGDARKFRYTHLAGALTFIPYGTMVDHFQHIAYEHPELTPAERNAEWARLSAIYMPWMKLEAAQPFYGEGRAWQRQRHIYESPFYYIDYCLAQTVSLEFWAMIQSDPKAAWDTYMKYTRPAGTMTFKELIANAGLVSPFGEDALREIASAAGAWLEKYDLTGLI